MLALTHQLPAPHSRFEHLSLRKPLAIHDLPILCAYLREDRYRISAAQSSDSSKFPVHRMSHVHLAASYAATGIRVEDTVLRKFVNR
jgi:hypothetical protein